MRYLLILSLGMMMAMTGCDNSDGGQNSTVKKAGAIHEEIMTRHDSIYSALEKEKARIEGQLNAGISNAKKKSAYQSMLRSIDKSFRILNSWEESVVGVPGFEHAHDHHGHHSHDHLKEEIAKGMSDREILQLQQALKERLEEVSTQINGLLTTIEMYDKNG